MLNTNRIGTAAEWLVGLSQSLVRTVDPPSLEQRIADGHGPKLALGSGS